MTFKKKESKIHQTTAQIVSTQSTILSEKQKAFETECYLSKCKQYIYIYNFFFLKTHKNSMLKQVRYLVVALTDKIVWHFSYTLWQHDQQTQCREAGGARGCGGCWKTAFQALEMLGLTGNKSKISLLIMRWGTQVQTLFLHNPFPKSKCFLQEPHGSKCSPSHFTVLL